MPTTVRSHAKINLGLYIGAPRPDGFHPLATVYQTIELHDYVTVTAHPAPETSIRLTSNDPRVPTDSRNTAWKMVTLALEDLAMPASVSIYIDKRLPIQGGLGAGSANAIAALVGLETELARFRKDVLPAGRGRTSWLDIPQLAEKMGVPEPGSPMFNTENWPSNQLNLAAKVGSDVPLFLIGGAVLGRGRGEIVYPLPDFDATWCLIATPSMGVSTPQAFRDWDALCAREGLTVDASEDRLEQLSRAYVSAFTEAMHGRGSSGVPANDRDLAGPQESALVRTGITSWIQNDFERVVFPQHPSLAEIKRLLATDSPEAARPASSVVASLSGSGSALFGLYLTQEDAQAAQQRLTAAGVQSQMTQTLPRSKYWSEMIVE